MTSNAKQRSGLVRYVGNIVDATKDFVDDIIDRGADVEHDLRNSARKVLDRDDKHVDHQDDVDVRQELAALKDSLAQLQTKLDQLLTPERSQQTTTT